MGSVTEIIFFSFCSLLLMSFTPPEISGEFRKVYYNRVNEINKEASVFVKGTGLAVMDELCGFTLAVNIESECGVSIEEARKELVRILVPLVDALNGNKKIRPYMHQFPFDWNSIDFSLSYVGGNGRYISSSVINSVFMDDGIVRYHTYVDSRKLGDQYIEIHKETYQEALDKVKQ